MLSGLLLLVFGAALVFSQAVSGEKPASDSVVAIEPRAANAGGIATPARSKIRVDSTLVLIPVTVIDPFNRFVTGLEKENFKLFEENVEQQIKHFSSEDAPLSIGVVFDTSGSMGNKLEKSRQAVSEFLKTANPQDEFFLVQFSDTASLIQPFTRDPEGIQNRLTFTKSAGRTALLDAIYRAIQEMTKAKSPRKALLLISDGGENASRYSRSEIKNLVKEADVQIYVIGIYEPVSSRSKSVEEIEGPSLLTEIAEQTGGREYAVDNVNEVPDIAVKIGVELRNQYMLGYSPQNQERNGKYRQVQVRLNPPRGLPALRAFWRMGYFAPPE
jgi:VWFA-related protein